MLNENKSRKFFKIFDFLHRHIVLIIIVVVVFSGALSTLLIVKGDAKPKGSSSETVTYEKCNTLYFSMNRVGTLNPLSSTDDDIYYISQLVYSSLFKLNENLELKKDIVDSYSTSASGGYVKLHLKDNVKFSDGSKLTAEDVKYTVNKISDIGSSSPYYSYISKIKDIDVSGAYSLTISFKNKTNAALDNLIFPIVSHSNYSESDVKVIGSGQYKYGVYDSTRFLKLKPNSYYFGTKAKNKLQFSIVPLKSKTMNLMTMDAVTAWISESKDADSDAKDKTLKSSIINSNEMEYLGFNFNNKTLANKDIRKAIAFAIDCSSIIKDDYSGAGIESDSIYFPGFLGIENKGDSYDINQTKAVSLLQKNGYKDKNEDGMVENKKGKTLSMDILVNSNNTSRVDSAYSIASFLEQIGIKTHVVKLSWSNYKTALKNGKFDLYLGGYKFDKIYNLKEMFEKSNNIGYNNKDIISDVRKLESCISASEEKSVYEDLKVRLNDDLPYYCLLYKTYTFVTVDSFSGETEPTFFNRYRGCSNWKWEKKIVESSDDSKDENNDKQ